MVLKVPHVFCSGDIFDKPNPSAELINFALLNLPRGMNVIPGQHDLKYHNENDWLKTGFGTLHISQQCVNCDLMNTLIGEEEECFVRGFGWNHTQKIEKLHRTIMKDCSIRVAFIHEYCYAIGHHYPGADKNHTAGRADQIWERFAAAGFTHVFCGDNHNPFWYASPCVNLPDEMKIANTGTFIRRKSDERSYKPMAMLLYANGRIEPHYWDTSWDNDKWLEGVEEKEERKQEEYDLETVITSLRSTLRVSENFTETLLREVKKHNLLVQRQMEEILARVERASSR